MTEPKRSPAEIQREEQYKKEHTREMGPIETKLEPARKVIGTIIQTVLGLVFFYFVILILSSIVDSLGL